MTGSQPTPADHDNTAMFAQLRQAMDLQRAGQTQEAEGIYRTVLEDMPGQPDALHMLGLIALRNGDYDRAITLIEQTIATAPDFPDAHNSLGIVLKRMGQTEKAAACYRRAIALKQAYPEAHHNLAIALQALGRSDEAEEAVMARLGLIPNDPAAQVDLGFLLHKKDRFEEAAAAFKRAIAAQPDNSDAWRNLSIVLSQLKRFDEAEQALRKWHEYDPDNPVAKHGLAAIGAVETPARASDGYVQQLFERMAPGFDEQLAKLGYRAPDLVARALRGAAGEPARGLNILDAGCGTGLCGPLVRGYAHNLTGVDLSSHMLFHAKERGCYDALITAELTAFLEERPAVWDAIVSADTLIYFGELGPVLTAAAGALTSLGWLIFSVELLEPGEQGYKLHRHGRYAHSEDYVRRTVTAAKLELRALGFETLRSEGGKPVAGLVVTARKAADPA